MKIYINKFFKDNTLEKYLGGTVEVYSRSGLNETEKRLIKLLPSIKEPERILILENRTGVLGMIAHNLFPDAEITMQNIDRYYCDKIEHNLQHNGFDSIKVQCEADISGSYDVILYQQSQANLIKELVFDLIQQSHQALKRHGKLYLSLEKKEKLITELMQTLFGGATIDNLNEKGLTLIGKKKNNEVKYQDYSDEFVLQDDGNELQYQSIPGVFAHHRIDEGAKALLHYVVAKSGETVLDMGCGIGSIGIALAKRVPLRKVYFVDSNARSIKMTEQNCKLNNVINYSTELTASGLNAPSLCQIVVGNPPYFSDFRIAGIFVDTAYKNLAEGGEAWFVAKSPFKLRELLEKKFGKCEELRYHGYSILIGTKK